MELIDVKALLVGAKGRFTGNQDMLEALNIAINILQAKNIVYRYKCISYCPPDCGTPEDDEYGYIPYCPTCSYQLEDLPKDNFCRKCGQHLNWDKGNAIYIKDGLIMKYLCGTCKKYTGSNCNSAWVSEADIGVIRCSDYEIK